jgi:cytochrome d ubiquinol oxidase subunit I
VSDLLAARGQMGLSLGFHIVFASLGVGLPVAMLAAEWLALRRGDALWRALARKLAKAFAVLFAVGAVSGTVLSFELGLLWPTFMGRFGGAIGLAFTLEGFAFFIEAIFLGIYLYGWDRLSARAHLWAGVPIAISGAASAAFVTTVNAWMNTPVAVTLDSAGRLVGVDPLEVMHSAAMGPEVSHMLGAAYLASGLAMAAVYAFALLRGGAAPHASRGLVLGLALGLPMAPVQLVTGDWAAKTVARTQPLKLAACEGEWDTRTHAPLRIGGWPDAAAETTRFALEVPGLLSWLAHGDTGALVRGLKSAPAELRPNPLVVHLAFQLMVGLGTALVALAFVSAASYGLRRRLPDGRWYRLAVVASGPAAFVAIEAGWTVTEVGRQPWVVQGLLRTQAAVTQVGALAPGFALAALIYGALGVGTVLVLLHLARRVESHA